MSILNKTYFQNEKAAFAHLEKLLWAGGVICPHCGTVGHAGRLENVKGKGGKTRLGLWKCYAKECRKQFTVRVGTVFESAHVPLHKMLQAVYLLSASKKGCSSHQLHRTLGVTYKTAWFLAHRIREAMRAGALAPMGGAGGIVEADETYFGKPEAVRESPQRQGRPYSSRGSRGPYNKRPIVTLVERGGRVRTFHVPVADQRSVQKIVRENIARESRLHTDESKLYFGMNERFDAHHTVKHTAGEYVRYTKAHMFPDGKPYVVHTNSAEGYFSIFKRGMRGVYQHCAEKHLHRYLAEFDFRYNNRIRLGVDDVERTARALRGVVGKRLTYRRPHEAAHA